MLLEILNVDDFCKDLPEVTHPKVDENSKIAKGGLFSQQIFGPFKSYRCGCIRSYYRGPNSGEVKCAVCGVDITSSEERSKRYAKISLPFEVINPLMYYLLIKAKPKSKKIIDEILFYRKKYCIYKDVNDVSHISYYVDDSQEFMDSLKKFNDIHVLQGLDGVEKYAEFLINKFSSETLSYVKANMTNFRMKSVIVTPPAFRNFSINSKGKMCCENRFVYLQNHFIWYAAFL